MAAEQLPPEILARLETLTDSAWSEMRGTLSGMSPRRVAALFETLQAGPESIKHASASLLDVVAALGATAIAEVALRQNRLLADEAGNLPDLTSPPYERPAAITGPVPGASPVRAPLHLIDIDDLPEPIVVFKTLDYSKDQV